MPERQSADMSQTIPLKDQPGVLILGGGMYGCYLALYYRQAGCHVTLLEREPALFARASYKNQARIHQGYHYPRSVITGLRCVANYERFAAEFGDAVVGSFEKIYAIARRNSHVTASQFHGFCSRVGAPIAVAPQRISRLFDHDLIEEVFSVSERAFDAACLRTLLSERLCEAGVDVRCDVEIERVEPRPSGEVAVRTTDGRTFQAGRVVACLYARVNTLLHNSGLPLLPFKYEIAELALVRPPELLRPLGLTVMDGPFFSIMPFPAENLHSFSHVRYTPHDAWRDDRGVRDPYRAIEAHPRQTHFTHMLKDATRYVPAIATTEFVRPLFEAKALLVVNDRNDGRPILLRRDYGMPGFHVVLGGKIDNIYDICQAIEPDALPQAADEASAFGAPLA